MVVQPPGLVPVLVYTGQTQISAQLQAAASQNSPTSNLPVLSVAGGSAVAGGQMGAIPVTRHHFPARRKQWRRERKGQTSMWARTVTDTLIMNASCIHRSSMSKSYFRLLRQLERMI